MRKNLLRAAGWAGLVDSATHTDTSGDYSFDLTVMEWRPGDICMFAMSSDQHDTYTVSPASFDDLFFSFAAAPHAIFGTLTLASGDTAIASSGGTGLGGSTMIGAVFRGFGQPATTASASSSSGMPNPPQVTGVVESDIVLITGHLDDDAVTATAPSGFELIQTVSISGVDQSTTMMAMATGLSGTVDPGAFGGGGTDYWHATTTILSRG